MRTSGEELTICHVAAHNAWEGDVVRLPVPDETLDLAAGFYVVTEVMPDFMMLSRCGEDESGQLVAQDEGQPVPVELLDRMLATGLRANEAPLSRTLNGDRETSPDETPDPRRQARYRIVGNVYALRRRQRVIKIGITFAPVYVGDTLAFETRDGTFVEQTVESLEILWHSEGALIEGGVKPGAEVQVHTELTPEQIRGGERVFRVRK